QAAARKLLEAQKDLIRRGGKPLAQLSPLRGVANLLSPALIDVTNISDREDEELFGPLLQLVRVDDFGAAIAGANNTRYGLAAGLLCDDRAFYDRFFREVRAGVIN